MDLPAGVDEVVFEELKEEYEKGEVVVFAGAGISAAAGLPTWKGLAELLIERMRQAKKPTANIDEAAALVQQGNLINAMSAARLALGGEFVRLLKKRLDDNGGAIPDAAKAIADLGPKLCGVVTTNLDRLLERAFHGAWPAILEPVADLPQRRRYIFKPHGTIDDANTWVFTRDEYEQAMFGSRALQDIFGALYRARTLLFVGASLSDDDFGLTLANIRVAAGRNLPTHYAILPEPVWPARRDQLERAGLRLLTYENKSGSHYEVVELLRALAGVSAPATGLRQGVHPGPAAAAAPAPGQGVHPGPGAVATPGLGQVATPKATPALAATPAPARAPTAVTGRVNVYISAAEADKRFRERLVEQLSPLEKAGLIHVSHAGQMLAGSYKEKTLGAMLSRAQIVLPLLSSDYTASAEQEQELASALTRADSGQAIVIPVLARPCLWQMALRGRDLKPLPASGKPLSTWSSLDDALVEVVLGVQGVAAGLQKKAQ